MLSALLLEDDVGWPPERDRDRGAGDLDRALRLRLRARGARFNSAEVNEAATDELPPRAADGDLERALLRDDEKGDLERD